jgi:hypothetical protein
MSLYGNIAAKKARIKAGSGEKMRKVGAKGAPAKGAFEAAALTAKKPKKGKKVMGISKQIQLDEISADSFIRPTRRPSSP